MRAGFTGTRNGMTVLQKDLFTRIVNCFRAMGVIAFHHGDCIGSDGEASAIVDIVMGVVGCTIVGHPPDRDSLRGYARCDEVRDKKPFIERDHDIVDETNILIATPATLYELQRSGTWATIRYAQRCNRPVVIIPPLDKKEVIENFHKRR